MTAPSLLSDLRTAGERLEATTSLDRPAEILERRVSELLPKGPLKDALHGVWLGHPLHPSLTDLPIGFWTSAFTLDLIGGKRSRRAADTCVFLGVVCAVPTALAGLADWSELNKPERRSGVVHAAANASATALYTLSLFARLRGRRATGVAYGLLGATAATVGGFLGGHLSFRRASGVNHAAEAPMDAEWSELTIDGELAKDKPTLAQLDGAPLAVVDTDAGPAALFAKCSHLAGPLHEGEVVDGCLKCPWHGSEFRMTDGTVARGPATAPQPAYEVRSVNGRMEARRRR